MLFTVRRHVSYISSMIQRDLIVSFLLVITIFSIQTATCQSSTSEPLDSLVSRIEQSYGVTFSFDPDLVKNKTIDISQTEDYKLTDWVNLISRESPFNVSSSGNDFYLLIPKTVQNLSIQLWDKKLNEPLIGAIGHISRSPKFESSDINGNIHLTGDFKATDTLEINFFGYKTQRIPLFDLKQDSLTPIYMASKSFNVTEVIIQDYMAPGINSVVNDHSLEIKPQDLALMPGETSGDILQSITSLPGITSPNTKAGNLHLRGSTSDQTLIYFDYIPLYNKGHFFGTISPFNQLVVEEVRIYRSGSHPRLGGRVGGVIDIKTESEIADSMRSSMGLSMTHVMGYIHAPIFKNKLSIMLSGRYALPSDLNTPRQTALNTFINQGDPLEPVLDGNIDDVLIYENSYHFEDLNGKIIYEPNKSNSIELSLLHAKSQQLREFEQNGQNIYSENFNGGTNQGVNLGWKKTWTPKTLSSHNLTYSVYSNTINNQISSISSDNLISKKFYHPTITTASLHSEWRTYGKREANYLDYGYSLDHHKNTISSEEVNLNQPNTKSLSEQDAYVHALFASYNIRSFKRLSLNIGNRLNYYTVSSKFYTEPRLFGNFTVSKSIGIKGSYSVTHQYLQQVIFFDFNDTKPENFNWGLTGGRNPDPIKSDQITLGGLFKKKTVTIDLEGYYKRINPIIASGGMSPAGGLLNFNGTAKMYGIDLLFRKKWSKLNTWVSYSISEVLWDFPRLSETPVNAYYDQRHKINLGSIYRLGPVSISASWKLVSGVPLLETQILVPPTPPGQPVPKRFIRQEGRFPWHHQFDISASYKWIPKSKKWNLALSATIQNLYDKKTAIELGNIGDRQYTTTTMGFSPNAQMIVNF